MTGNGLTAGKIRFFCDQVQLVVFDLAGTTVDYGCIAPVAAFVDGFKQFGVDISPAQAREPMGMEKRAHIRAIAEQDSVARQWREVHGRNLAEEDIDAMYEAFAPLLLQTLADYSDIIPGVEECLEFLTGKGIPYAATTGYFRQATDVVLTRAAEKGFVSLVSCCATEVPAGRPAPWMIFYCMQAAGVYPPCTVINVGDTRVDVESGRNAGAWSIGVAATGNGMGLSAAEIQTLDEGTYRQKLNRARQSLLEAGAHDVIDSVAELPRLILDIERRLRRGETP